MRDVKLKDVLREVKKAYDGQSCGGASYEDCVDCEARVRDRYERWFITCWFDGYLALVDSSEPEHFGDFLCPMIARGLRKCNEGDELPEREADDKIIEYVRLV